MKNKAVFLDRDGVLCKELGRYLANVKEFEILPYVPSLLGSLKEKGYLLIMISNQGVISRGTLSLDQVNEMHRRMQAELTSSNAQLDALYFCPHHPEVEACICRKPEPLMIQKAMARFDIDPKSSIMIGDSPRDVESAERTGVKGFMVKSNETWQSIVDQLMD
ncbi:MAG: D-glycero-D-manno-heptose 1,7-bisphosphate phosphatase [Granulosicoccus sp.]|jgi:D-glycero-D-manno-heptose 1,7-bisphosphate phosphatase